MANPAEAVMSILQINLFHDKKMPFYNSRDAPEYKSKVQTLSQSAAL
jgi:tellurite resistance-related uncharacterized protein